MRGASLLLAIVEPVARRGGAAKHRRNARGGSGLGSRRRLLRAATCGALGSGFPRARLRAALGRLLCRLLGGLPCWLFASRLLAALLRGLARRLLGGLRL